MAGMDYVSCGECGKRLFYDGDRRVRDSIHEHDNTVALTCDHCVNKLHKKIEKLKKYDRRKH